MSTMDETTQIIQQMQQIYSEAGKKAEASIIASERFRLFRAKYYIEKAIDAMRENDVKRAINYMLLALDNADVDEELAGKIDSVLKKLDEIYRRLYVKQT